MKTSGDLDFNSNGLEDVSSEQYVQPILLKGKTCKSRTHSYPKMENKSAKEKEEYVLVLWRLRVSNQKH